MGEAREGKRSRGRREGRGGSEDRGEFWYLVDKYRRSNENEGGNGKAGGEEDGSRGDVTAGNVGGGGKKNPKRAKSDGGGGAGNGKGRLWGGSNVKEGGGERG